MVRLLLSSAIDYAGLFPPASLDMNSALEEYARCREGPFSWALGRFIVPVSQLDQLRQGLEVLPAHQHIEDSWPLGVLGGTDPGSDQEKISGFHRRCAAASVEAVEWKLGSAGAIERVEDVFKACQVYYEIPVTDGCRELLDAVAGIGARAKVRTGGITAEMIPPARLLARFIHICAEMRVPFKATAGLHHPIRSVRPLTYAPGSPSGLMHGFLNVLAASAAAYMGAGIETLEQILCEESLDFFTFDDSNIGCRGLRITADCVSEMRERLFVSFGSCSIREPLAGLESLGLV